MTWQEPDYARGTHCFALHVTHSRDGGQSFSTPAPLAADTSCNTASGQRCAGRTEPGDTDETPPAALP